MTARERQPADRLTGSHHDAHPDQGANRLVGREQPVGVQHRHHAHARDPAGEVHDAGTRRPDGLPGTAEQVDAAVAGQPGLCGGREPMRHPGRAAERPCPPLRSSDSGLRCRDAERHAEEPEQDKTPY